MLLFFTQILHQHLLYFFFFNDTATTEIYTLSLHDALPIYNTGSRGRSASASNEGGSMLRLIRLAWVPVALMLGACDVQVHDETPAEYPANHDIGMYDIKATVTRDALVAPGSVFLFALDRKST